MKRKGFTLIELLAVIIILAVISLITIPIIGNIIEDSKKKVLEQSIYGIVEAANYFTLSNDGDYHFVFSEGKNGVATTGEKLDYKGTVDANGELYIDSDGNISLCLMNETYYVYKNYNSGIYIGNVSDDTCIVGYDALTNKYVAMLDDGTGQVSNVYSRDDVDRLVTNLQSQIYSNDTDIEILNTMVNTNTNDISTLKGQVEELRNNSSDTFVNVSNLITLSSDCYLNYAYLRNKTVYLSISSKEALKSGATTMITGMDDSIKPAFQVYGIMNKSGTADYGIDMNSILTPDGILNMYSQSNTTYGVVTHVHYPIA